MIAQVGCASHCSPRQALPAPDEWRTLYPEVKQMCDACLKKERKDERVRVLDELMKWLEPQDLRLLKQKMWRKLEFLRCEEGTGDGDG